MTLRNAFADMATEATLAEIARGITDVDVRLDYDVRTDSQPVYLGRALAGTLTTSLFWVLEKITYDGLARPTLKQTKSGAWDSRATYF